MFERIAIVNRGEPARRLIHAAHEVGEEIGRQVRTIALHTQAERRATFVREADEAVLIGGPTNPYLNHEELERALVESRADAAWVGWGFVAEDPTFVELCDRLGITFIGPPADVMRKLGDKIGAKILAEANGVPVAPWSGGPVDTVEDALRHAADIGFPLMIKATAGGGGRGIRRVESEEELATSLERAREEARRSFGDPTVLMERVVSGARHVEVQVMADAHGNAWALGVRDCSVQRRNQKLIEESASPALEPEQARELAESAVRLVKAAGYRNAGTVEFLYQPEERLFAFLEVNTRLQVEHPVTEATSGIDLVKLQLLVAGGEPLEGDPPVERGHAIEARLNTEDPQRGFAPAPGVLRRLRFPSGPGIRVDTGFIEGDEIPPEYDSMIAKIIAWGADRGEARARLRRALAETSVVVEGGASNRVFLMHLLDHPDVVAGTVDTGWLDRLGTDGLLPERDADVALIAAAIEACDAEEAIERDSFYATAHRGRPEATPAVETPVELRHRGQGYRLVVGHLGPDQYRITIDGTIVDVRCEHLGRFERRITVNDRVSRVTLAPSPPDLLAEVDGVAHRVSRDEGGLVRSPAPALVVAIPVAEGDEVEAGAPVIVVESMKMETTLTAPFSGHVREVMVAGNVQVAAGTPLMRLEPSGAHDGEDVDTDRVDFAGDAASQPGLSRVLADMRSLVLGYDVDAAGARRLVTQLEEQVPGSDPKLWLTHKLDILGTFADLAELSRDRPPVEADHEERVHSPKEAFLAFLRSLDAEREGTSELLKQSLTRALAHYGVNSLEPSYELRDACFRIFLSHQRASIQIPVVLAVLEHLRRRADDLTPEQREELRATLDRLIVATQLRHPVVGNLARAVRFGCFDMPAAEGSRIERLQQVRAALDELTTNPTAADAAERMAHIVDSEHPLIPLLGERLKDGLAPDEPMLEVLTRRYYKIRALRDLQRVERDGGQFMTGTYERLSGGRPPGRQVQLITTITTSDAIAAAVEGVCALATEHGGDAVADVYVAWPSTPEPDEIAATLASHLDAADVPASLSRIVFSISDPVRETDLHFTFRQNDDSLTEERVARGLHPMIARRLRLWRLNRFDIERLDAVEDTYLFRCTTEDGGEERLVALAEVRHIDPARRRARHIDALPEVERILGHCLESIRAAQAGRPPTKALQANHVFLYLWPHVDFPMRDLVSIARNRLAPMTAGLGLEEVLLHVRQGGTDGGEADEMALSFSYQPGAGSTVSLSRAPEEPLAPLGAYDKRKLPARRRGTVYPYELVPLLTENGGSFVEHDLDDEGRLVPVDRPPGGNTAGIVCGVVTTPTQKHPEGITRVILMGDPTKSLGSVAEPECHRVCAALDLAEEMGVPLEWFALSSGAKISRDSGVENMDWVARALRRIIEFTQRGGEINVVVAGINVGAQPYWNAEATMLMHTKGILIMTPDSAMVLTGKQALDYSGGVSADDNFGIGGYDRIMGPNGQAQYWAPHLAGACDVLFAYYDHAYVMPGERFVRRGQTNDPAGRDIREMPLDTPTAEFANVGEIFSDLNAERKRAFEIRPVMRAVADQDHEPLERWGQMADADTAVVFDVHLGGRPVMMIGIESRPIPRHGFLPADGPDQWTAGTLFPVSSKKVARAINASSGSRPLVVLANLSGFDGSPESLRKWQLEFGAEIGRAVVNFDGPIVFCVISRYHGGAFVVFSAALNDHMEVIAVEGSYASVIGGAPAAAVVFARDVDQRTDADPRIAEFEEKIAQASGAERAALLAKRATERAAVRSEKLGEVATEFDQIHSIQRAQQKGAVHTIIPASRLRPYLIEAVERGVAKFEAMATDDAD